MGLQYSGNECHQRIELIAVAILFFCGWHGRRFWFQGNGLEFLLAMAMKRRSFCMVWYYCWVLKTSSTSLQQEVFTKWWQFWFVSQRPKAKGIYTYVKMKLWYSYAIKASIAKLFFICLKHGQFQESSKFLFVRFNADVSVNGLIWSHWSECENGANETSHILFYGICWHTALQICHCFKSGRW